MAPGESHSTEIPFRGIYMLFHRWAKLAFNLTAAIRVSVGIHTQEIRYLWNSCATADGS